MYPTPFLSFREIVELFYDILLREEKFTRLQIGTHLIHQYADERKGLVVREDVEHDLARARAQGDQLPKCHVAALLVGLPSSN